MAHLHQSRRQGSACAPDSVLLPSSHSIMSGRSRGRIASRKARKSTSAGGSLRLPSLIFTLSRCVANPTDGSCANFPKIEKSKFRFARESQGRHKPMNPTQLSDQQCLTIWNCCFDPHLRQEVPLEYVPDCIRLCLEPESAGTIDGLESMALELWEQGEGALALQLGRWACERRELN
jgi:hypothetical protein